MMLNLTDQFFWEAYQTWFTRGTNGHRKGFSLDNDVRFTSEQYIIKRHNEERLKNRGEHIQLSSHSLPYFNLIFDELRKSVDRGDMVIATSFEADELNYYVGCLGDNPWDHTCTVLIYTTRHNIRDLGCSGDDYKYDELVIIGYPPDEKFDAYFRVSISADSSKVHTKLSNSIMNGMMHDLIYNIYVDKSDNGSDEE